jgi:DNA-binding helix-hairpin-helix protein with protein kinase domain
VKIESCKDLVHITVHCDCGAVYTRLWGVTKKTPCPECEHDLGGKLTFSVEDVVAGVAEIWQGGEGAHDSHDGRSREHPVLTNERVREIIAGLPFGTQKVIIHQRPTPGEEIDVRLDFGEDGDY